jgi:hypothetical protein
MNAREQPEALLLAECLEQHEYCTLGQMSRAAVELRRLSALNQQLLKAVKDSDKLIEQLMPGIKHIALQDYAFLNDTLMANTAAIKAGEQA